MSHLMNKKETNTESISEIDRYISLVVKEEYTPMQKSLDKMSSYTVQPFQKVQS
jgi:hypothetical protein